MLILDEDTFIVNWKKVMELCVYMKENNYTHSGVPDGGLLRHITHSYITMNPFFLVFNCSILNPVKKKYSRSIIDAHEFRINMQTLKPEWTNDQYQNDSFEPFAGLFYWMAEHGRPLFLKASTMSDGISTKVFDVNNTAICLHAWYSRLYDQDCKEKNRIDELYVCATNIAKTCQND